MALAIVGDIHSNLAALQAVLAEIDKQEIERILFVGDLVGYNASPSEVIELCKERGFLGISGNHDRYTTGQAMRDIREATVEAVEYTQREIGGEGIAFLREFPISASSTTGYMLVHGSICDRDEYMLTVEVIAKNLNEFRENFAGIDVCFFGHSHFPAVVGGGRVDMRFQETRNVKLDPLKQYMVNPGSVGQPRDGCPKASFAVFDPQAYMVTVTRVEYDVQDSHDRVLAAGLGRGLAERLLVGR